MTSHVSPVSGMDPAANPTRNADPAAVPPMLIESKLTPPIVAQSIERSRLLDALDAAAERRLVVLAAPGGYGKSTLLGQWRARGADRAIAWLSLDGEDSEPACFRNYLSAAIARLTSGLQTQAGANAILATLAHIPRPLWIVLDDFHELCGPLLQEISFLIRRAPPAVHWVVAGRCIPGLDLSQHRLHDQLTLFDAAALAFTRAETTELALRSGIELPEQQLTRIHDVTEGWAAGLKLTLLATKPAASLDPEVSRYFSSVILAVQTPQLRELLQVTALVDRLNGELCNALLDSAEGAAVLAQLEQCQLFIRHEGEGGWYRYHGLFREFLRSQPSVAPERIAQLHRRASQWYADHQLGEDALRHAFASGDHAWSIELTARCARHWLKVGEIGLILQWVSRLSRAEIVNHELIGPIYCTCLIWRRRYKEAVAALHDTRTALLTLGEQTAATQARMRTLQVMLDILSGSTDNIDLTEEQPADGRDTFLTATLMALQAYWLLGRCRFDLARRLALRAREIMQQHDTLYALSYVNGVIALADRGQGDFTTARGAIERVFAAVDDKHSAAWTHAAALLGRMRYEENHLDAATGLFTEVLPRLAGTCTVEHVTTVHIGLARIKAAQGLFAEGFALLDYLHSTLERGGPQSFLAHVCYEKVRLHLLDADRERAAAVAADFGLAQRWTRGDWQEPREYSMSWEQFGLAQAALLLDSQQYDACRTLLNTLLASVYRAGFIGRAVPLEAGLAVCEWRAGEQASAFARRLRCRPPSGI